MTNTVMTATAKNNDNDYKDYKKLCRLGCKIMLMAPTGTGKSTFSSRLLSEKCRSIGDERLSDGRGTRTLTYLAVTDDSTFPIDKVYVTAKILEQKMVNVDHLGEVTLLGALTHKLALFFTDSREKDKSYKRIREVLCDAFKALRTSSRLDNLSLINKLYQINPDCNPDDLIDFILEKLLKPTPDYEKALIGALNKLKKKAKSDKSLKGNKLIRSFETCILIDRESEWYQEGWAQTFYAEICDIINKARNEAVRLIRQYDGICTELEDGTIEFEVFLDDSTAPLNKLLMSPNGRSVEFMLTDFYVMTRAEGDFLNDPKFEVFRRDGVPVHQAIVVDTQGLAHDQNDDKDRVIADIEQVNPMIIMLISPLLIDASAKEGGKIATEVLMELKSDISVLPLFNKYDLKLLDKGKSATDLEAAANIAETECNALCDETLRLFGEAVDSNTNNHKPRIITGKKFIFGENNVYLKEHLSKNPERTYQGAIPKIFAEIANNLRNKVCTIRDDQIPKLRDISIAGTKFFNTESAAKNIADCIAKTDKLFWITIYTALEKWERSGEPHQSHAKVYADVNTDFVRLIKAIPAQSMELISYSPEGQAFLNANPRFAELIKFNSYRFQTLFARKIACYAKNAVTQKYPNRWLSCYDNFRFILQSTLNLFSKKDPLTGKIGVTVPDGTCAPDVIKDTITDSFKEYLGLLVNENCIISL